MSQANRNLVADALESGEFEQGTYALCEDGRHCCLGVACEVYQRHVGDLVIAGGTLHKSYDSEEEVLPEKVQKWLGFSSSNGEFGNDDDDDDKDSLTELNDTGIPFTEIAKLFRNPPEGLVDDTSES